MGKLAKTPMFSTLTACARHRAQDSPDQTALTFLREGEYSDQSLTFAELDQRARAIAHHLTELELSGRRALLMFHPGLTFVEALFGCFYAGVVAVPAFPPRQNRHGERVELIAKDAESDVVLTSSDFFSLAPRVPADELSEDMRFIAVDGIPAEAADLWKSTEPDPHQVAMLQYTSGSTGHPKGVILTHENLAENCRRIHEAFSVRPTDVGVSWLPTYHDMGLVGHVLEPVWAGNPSILMAPVAFLQSPVRWLKAISAHRGSVSGAPNFAYELCVRKVRDESMQGVDLTCWEIAYNGSETVRADTLDRFFERFAPFGFRREAFYPCYGMAESTLIVAGGQRAEIAPAIAFDGDAQAQGVVRLAAPNTENTIRLVSCGKAVGNQLLLIVDPESKQGLGESRVGEVWIAGESVAQGYFERREESSQTFHAVLNGRSANGARGRRFLRTGDLGFIRDGELFITGRIKDLIIVRGVNRYPQDIERAVEGADPSFAAGSVAAFAIEAGGKEHLVVVCETDRSQTKSTSELVKGIRQVVAAEQSVLVDAVALVRRGTIPKTSSGKIQRFACRKAFLDGTLGEFYRWTSWEERSQQAGPRKSANETLSRVLQVAKAIARDRGEGLAADTDLTKLGLDSLERMEIATRLETDFNCCFTESELLATESCRDLAALIEQKANHAANQPDANVLPQCKITEFPEYQQLKRTQHFLSRHGYRNPFHQPHDGIARSKTSVDGRELLSFSTYNYLGLSGDPMVAAAAKRAIDQYGTSVSASRVVAGERPIHRQLEKEIAAWVGTEDAITFVGGHSTNETTIGHLVGPRDLIVHDELAHNSILQGALLSGAERRSFPHNNWQALNELLAALRPKFRRVLVAIEGVYSMDGDFPDLPKFVDLRRHHGFLLMVDEAHSLGTMGTHGRGIAEHFGIDANQVDIWMGTLSKALGSCGGYIAGSKPLIELLRYTAPGFVYSVGMSPANAAAALAALHRLHADPSLVSRCQANAKSFRDQARALGLNTGLSQETPVIPIILGNSHLALTLAGRLNDRGISVHPILYPAVPESAARLRFFISSEHRQDQIRRTVTAVYEELLTVAPDRIGMRERPPLQMSSPTQSDEAVDLLDNSQFTQS